MQYINSQLLAMLAAAVSVSLISSSTNWGWRIIFVDWHATRHVVTSSPEEFAASAKLICKSYLPILTLESAFFYSYVFHFWGCSAPTASIFGVNASYVFPLSLDLSSCLLMLSPFSAYTEKRKIKWPIDYSDVRPMHAAHAIKYEEQMNKESWLSY